MERTELALLLLRLSETNNTHKIPIEPKINKSHLLQKILRHSCDLCPYETKYKWLLNRHMLCHTGERPYACYTCGRRFRQTAHLAGHVQTHVNPNKARKEPKKVIHSGGKIIFVYY